MIEDADLTKIVEFVRSLPKTHEKYLYYANSDHWFLLSRREFSQVSRQGKFGPKPRQRDFFLKWTDDIRPTLISTVDLRKLLGSTSYEEADEYKVRVADDGVSLHLANIRR